MGIFKENDLYGLKDDRGEIIITPQYRDFYPFSCGLACVRNIRYQYAFIDIKNNPIIPFGKFIWLDYKFVCGFARAKLIDNKHWVIIDTTGKIITKTHYTSIWCIRERYLPYVKAFIGDRRDDIVLDEIKYIKTYTIEEFKELFNCTVIRVKKNKENQLFIQYGENTGRVAYNEVPKNPAISIVKNSKGHLFVLLHEQFCLQESEYSKEEQVAQNEKCFRIESFDYQSNDYEEQMEYIESSYYDAFEGDESNYWNID